MESPQPPLPPTLPPQPQRGRLSGRLVAVGVTGLMVGAAVVGLGGMASADEPTLNETADITESIAVVDGDFDGDFDGEAFEISAEDEAVFERYEQCLSDAGIPVLELEADVDEAELDAMTDAEWEALEDRWDAAAETCDPILEDLSEEAFAIDGDFDAEAFDLSPEDEAVFERYDDCLAEAGVPALEFDAEELELEAFDGEEGVIELDEFDELTDEEWEAFDEAHEQAFEACDPILEDLSDDAMFAVEGCEDYDGEVVEGHILEDGDDVLEVVPAEQA